MRNNRSQNTRFWVISALVHGAAFVVLLFTPAGQRILKREDRPPRPEIIRRNEELAEVVEDIRDLAVMRMRPQVAQIAEINARMEDQVESAGRDFAATRAHQLASAAERLNTAARGVRDLQQGLLDALRAHGTDPALSADPLRERFEQSRLGIVNGQEEIRRALLLAAPDASDRVEAQREAEEVQLRVFASIPIALETRSRVHRAETSLPELRAERMEIEKNLPPYEEELEQLREQYPVLKDERTRLGAARRKDEHQLKTAREKAEKTEEGSEDRQRRMAEVEKRTRDLEATRAEYQKVDTAFNELRERVNFLKRHLQTYTERKPKIEEQIPKLEAGIPRWSEENRHFTEKAIRDQEEVIRKQQAVVDWILNRLREGDA